MFKFTFKNELLQLMHLSLHDLFSEEMTTNPSTRSHKPKTCGFKEIQLSNLPGDAFSFFYRIHMPFINWYCVDNILYFCDHITCTYTFVQKKQIDKMLCVWHSPNVFTGCAMYTGISTLILFLLSFQLFLLPFAMSFSLT